jgi:hypothetical protein
VVFGIVGNDQALEPLLDEALCTYAEHLYYEKYSQEGFESGGGLTVSIITNPKGISMAAS